MSVLPEVHFGKVGEPLPDWRGRGGPMADDDPDDEILETTPDDVIGILGFDPREFQRGEKGGEGSGNFGHSGRPGEVGGSSSDTAGGTFYHGTHGYLMNEIADGGIKPQSTHTFEEDSGYYTGDRADAVFVTRNYESAKEYAKMTAGNLADAEEIDDKVSAIIFKIKVPKGTEMNYDSMDDFKGSRYFKGSIPASWIQSATVIRASDGKEGYTVRLRGKKNFIWLDKIDMFDPKYVVLIARIPFNKKEEKESFNE